MYPFRWNLSKGLKSSDVAAGRLDEPLLAAWLEESFGAVVAWAEVGRRR
jgi:hypothetical protein